MKTLRSPLVLLLTLGLVLPAGRAADIVWTNAGSGAWSNPLNWSPNILPGSNDGVIIDQASLTNRTVITLDLDAAASNLTLKMGRSFLRGDRTLAVLGHFHWAGGNFQGAGTLELHGTALITNAGSSGSNSIVGWTLNNHGTVRLDRVTGVNLPPEIALGTNTTIKNLPGATFEHVTQSGGAIRSLSFGTMPPRFLNYGTLRSSGVWSLSARFSNYGLLEMLSGVVFLSGSTSTNQVVLDANQYSGQVAIKGGDIYVDALDVYRGILSGVGQVTGAVRIAGQVVPGVNGPGRLRVGAPGSTGIYLQRSSGSLNIEIGGTVPETQYDQLAVKARASHAGSVNVCLINNFIPSPGDRFEILTATNITNNGLIFNGLQVSRDIYLQPNITATNITLVAVSTPPITQPVLSIFQEGEQVTLCWPRGFEDFTLRCTETLPAASWTPWVLTEPNRLIVPPSGAARFFQFFKP